MKGYYLAVSVTQDRNHNIFEPDQAKDYDPGNYAFVIRCTGSDNLKALLDTIGGLRAANICQSKKAASELVTAWNEAYKRNGSYLYDSPTF